MKPINMSSVVKFTVFVVGNLLMMTNGQSDMQLLSTPYPSQNKFWPNALAQSPSTTFSETIPQTTFPMFSSTPNSAMDYRSSAIEQLLSSMELFPNQGIINQLSAPYFLHNRAHQSSRSPSSGSSSGFQRTGYLSTPYSAIFDRIFPFKQHQNQISYPFLKSQEFLMGFPRRRHRINNFPFNWYRFPYSLNNISFYKPSQHSLTLLFSFAISGIQNLFRFLLASLGITFESRRQKLRDLADDVNGIVDVFTNTITALGIFLRNIASAVSNIPIFGSLINIILTLVINVINIIKEVLRKLAYILGVNNSLILAK